MPRPAARLSSRTVSIYSDQQYWARRQPVNRLIFTAGWRSNSTVHSHIVLGLPAGCFQSFGGLYVSEWEQCMCIVCLVLHVIHPGCYLFILDLGKVRNTVQTITYLPQKGLHNNNIYRVLKHLRKLKQLHYYITIQFNKTGPTLLF